MAIIALIIALVTAAACITPFSSSSSSGGVPTALQETPSISPAIPGIHNLSVTPIVSTGHIEVLVQGGSDTNLTMLTIDIISPSGTKSTLTVNMPPGESKLTSAASGIQHIVVTGQFSDGAQQSVYDHYVDVPQ